MSDFQSLYTAVSRRRRVLDALSGEARAVLLRGKEIKEEIELLKDDIGTYERANAVLNSIGEEKQLSAQKTIEEIVTRGLQTIFDDTLSFHIVQKVVGRRAEVEFVVRTTLASGYVVDTPVMDARGGGLATTIGFLLRLVILLLRGGPKEENMLVLDETFSMVSAEYLDSLGEFLREIVTKTGVQIVFVTHQPVFADYADKVYRFGITDGETWVKEES